MYVENLRATVTAKSAQVDTANQQRDFFKDQVAELEKRSPEVMERRLSDRIAIRDAEIERLGEDTDRNAAALLLLEEEKVLLQRSVDATQGFREMLRLDEAEGGGYEVPETLEVVKLGEVGVDSGQLLITDPCYLDSEWVEESYGEHRVDTKPPFPYSYDGACHASMSNGYGELAYKLGHAGAGVAFTTAFGDGAYPIYGEKHDGRIVRVYVNVG